MALRWGIVSAGKISHDFVNALNTLPKEDHSIVAVAARSLDSAQDFAKLHGISRSYAGYAALAKDPEIGNSELLTISPLTNHHSHFRGRLHWGAESAAPGSGPDDAGPRQARPLREALVHQRGASEDSR